MICEEEAVVYFSSIANRRFFTKKGAIDAETRALIKNKYPTEKPEYENGQLIYSGFYWESDIKRADVLFRRLRKIVKKSFDSDREKTLQELTSLSQELDMGY